MCSVRAHSCLCQRRMNANCTVAKCTVVAQVRGISVGRFFKHLDVLHSRIWPL
jgi:hypothetical protein